MRKESSDPSPQATMKAHAGPASPMPGRRKTAADLSLVLRLGTE